MSSQTNNAAGKTFLDNIDEIALGIFGDDKHLTSAGMSDYQEALAEAFASDIPLVPPTYALVKVTHRCNARCSYCIHGQDEPVAFDPSTNDLLRVIQQIAELGVKSISFSGGEAMLRADLPELIQAARSLGLVPILHTNGTLLRKRRAEMVRSGVEYVLISFDTLSADVFELHRGVPIEAVLEGIETARAMRHEDSPNLVIGITAVMTRYNIAELPELLQWVADRQMSLQITPYHHFDPTMPDLLSPRDRGQMEEIIDQLIAMHEAGYPLCNSIGYLRGIPIYSFEHRLPHNYCCYTSHTNVFVDADLNVRPCWSWSIPVAANLRHDNLVTAWNSEAFVQGRAQVRQLQCARCWMLCTAEISMRFQELWE
jgi:MoaA/NifB/PqqE/SkfB family radical SAM enzyme